MEPSILVSPRREVLTVKGSTTAVVWAVTHGRLPVVSTQVSTAHGRNVPTRARYTVQRARIDA